MSLLSRLKMLWELYYRIVASESGAWWDYEGKLRIAQVIMNRVNSGMFGGSLYDVITQPGQFDVFNNGRYLHVNVTDDIIQACEQAYAGIDLPLPRMCITSVQIMPIGITLGSSL